MPRNKLRYYLKYTSHKKNQKSKGAFNFCLAPNIDQGVQGHPFY